MYLVGARFENADAANAALDELRDQIEVEEDDVGLRPLGSLRYEEPDRGLVLAGRFGQDDVDRVVAIMNGHGGEIVFKRAEWRLPRPLSRAGERAGARCAWLSRLRR